jgi:hypothetical protein
MKVPEESFQGFFILLLRKNDVTLNKINQNPISHEI